MANRLLGLFFAAFGALMLLVVIPWQTEVIEYGWMRPRTLPNAMAAVIAAAGLILAMRPRGEIVFERRRAARAALYFAAVLAAVWLISLFGFELVAPVLALGLMLLLGERRPLWLAIGVIGVPLAIWLAVPVLLDRPLP
jgi:putative tricarboxylic transport membrane protein